MSNSAFTVSGSSGGSISSVVGTAGRITSTGGSNPIINLDPAYIASVAQGGTGLSTLTTPYGVVCAGTAPTTSLQNAGAGTAGQVLTSNGGAAIPTFQAPGGVGSILQVISSVKTDTFTTSLDTPVDVPNLSVTITPSNVANKIMVFCQVTLNGWTGATGSNVNLVRGATNILLGDAAGSRARSTASDYTYSAFSNSSKVIMFLDSPATTGATTYKIQAFAGTVAAIYINRSYTDTDSADNSRVTSTITVMEVKG